MTLKSSSHQYGTVAVLLHWASAILVFGLIGSGLRAGGIEDAAAKIAVLRIHVPLGIAILALTLARIAWWAFADHKPASIKMPTWQARTSRAVHGLFYIVILGMSASGIGMLVLSNAGPIIFGQSTATMPNFRDFLPRTPHGVGAKLLMALFVLHAGAALYHHFFKHDDLLRRMWFSTRSD